MSNFQLNPCDACIKAYGIDDINNINQCCSDTYAAFAGVSSINNVRNLESFKNCEQCVQNSIKALGRDKCNFRITSYPVWTQSPHYFPNLFQETNNVETARNKCLEMCNQSSYPNECKKNCIIDSMAVVENTKENFLGYNTGINNTGINNTGINNIINPDILPFNKLTRFTSESTKPPISTKPQTSIQPPTSSQPPKHPKHPKHSKKDNLEFFLSFTLGAVLFSILIVLFLKIMFKK